MPYILASPRNRWESRVQAAGYPYFITVVLNPPHIIDPIDHPFRVTNNLNTHSHSSHNTHYIIKGSLTLDCNVGSNRVHTLTISQHGEKEISVPAGVSYSGRPGTDGAIFVEGHSILSPTTADRFERRGALIWFDDGSGQTRQEWIMQQAMDLQEEVDIRQINARPIRG